MLHHAPSAGRSLHLRLPVLSPFCHELVYETSLHSSCISLMVLRAPLHLCCIRSKGTTSTTYCVSGNVALRSLRKPNPRKLCQDGARIKGIGASAVGSGWHVGWDEAVDETVQGKPVYICMYLCIHLPYQTDAELCPSIVSPLCSEVQVPL